MNVEKVLAREVASVVQEYTDKDTILYALGVGLGAKPLDPRYLRFVYEEGLQAMPTIANVLANPGFWMQDPVYGIDWKKILHAEQRLKIHTLVLPQGKVVSSTDIMGLRDLGSRGMMLHQRKQLRDVETNSMIATTITSMLLRGDIGGGSHGEAPTELERLPEVAPDVSMHLYAAEILPLIYRLSGDRNPLHIDPATAADAGFARPILHGLSSMALALSAVMERFCDMNPERIKSVDVRFSRPVYPGDSLLAECWSEGSGRLRFRVSAEERGEVVLDRGVANLA